MIISFLHTCLQSYTIVVTHTATARVETGAHVGEVCISMFICLTNVKYVVFLPFANYVVLLESFSMGSHLQQKQEVGLYMLILYTLEMKPQDAAFK